jgi:hypothetical protein
MRQIEFHDDANLEMKAAAQHYEERVEGLGEQFFDEIEEGLCRIQQFPLAWSAYEGSIDVIF